MKKNPRSTFLAGIIALSVAGMVGCSSVPTQAELQQLEELQAEIRSLEQHKAELIQERTTLAAAISTKVAQLQEINNKKNSINLN
ncbi:MAG: hypothetical protein HYV29_00890 [Ignavibacteriales bacterium]|nr:hypothetical protein [Ignavibacteriales bacterium]